MFDEVITEMYFIRPRVQGLKLLNNLISIYKGLTFLQKRTNDLVITSNKTIF